MKQVSYGTSIHTFPSGATLFSAMLSDVAAKGKDDDEEPGSDRGTKSHHAVLGVATVGRGGVAVFGDSNCLDSSHRVRGFGGLSGVDCAGALGGTSPFGGLVQLLIWDTPQTNQTDKYIQILPLKTNK
jgi:hypothetical protein